MQRHIHLFVCSQEVQVSVGSFTMVCLKREHGVQIFLCSISNKQKSNVKYFTLKNKSKLESSIAPYNFLVGPELCDLHIMTDQIL